MKRNANQGLTELRAVSQVQYRLHLSIARTSSALRSVCTIFVKVCAGNTLFAERQQSQKGRFSDATRQGLTFTNNRNGVIFAFHFYFF